MSENPIIQSLPVVARLSMEERQAWYGRLAEDECNEVYAHITKVVEQVVDAWPPLQAAIEDFGSSIAGMFAAGIRPVERKRVRDLAARLDPMARKKIRRIMRFHHV